MSLRISARPLVGGAARALALVLLLTAGPARAALEADVVLVYGSSWRQVLPAYAAAAKAPEAGSPAVARLPPVILWTTGEERWTEDVLRRLEPKKVVSLGPPGASGARLEIPGEVRHIEATDERMGSVLANAAFDEGDAPPAVYVAGGSGLGPALAAAALAAADRAPLLLAGARLHVTVREAGALARKLGAKEIVVVGEGDATALAAAGGRRVKVLSGDEALAAYAARARSRHLVLASPADATGPFSPPKLSLLSVPYALGKGAALSWVDGSSPEEVAAALESRGEGPYDFVTIIGDHLAVPMRHVEDIDQVAAGKADPRIHKVPPFVDPDGAASDRAVGRLAALDAYDLSRWVARLLHDVSDRQDGKGALVLANADHKFILGEAISRTTSAELANAGVRVESFYREEITPELIRKELPGHGLVLWEGHPRDLTLDDDALPAPESSLPPATFFLQGCYTLDRSDPYLLIERGATSVIGTYMAVYSASGSGFARAFLSSQLHEGETAGEALASARNYLLAIVELKKRRGHKDWRKTLRAALSFDLWGDPTAPLSVRARRPRKAAVTASLRGDRISMRIPASRLPRVEAGPYNAEIRPGAQLSALYDVDESKPGRRLVELFFAKVKLPPELGDDPQITAPYDESTYAWVWAPRTRKLSLLVHEAAVPKGAGRRDVTLRFQVHPGGKVSK
ncbi:MAG TPA: hypothetical protein VN033_14135 [Vulgatibacter sp.]|nr:hypothetical protein [Vulgatibacter sp.]